MVFPDRGAQQSPDRSDMTGRAVYRGAFPSTPADTWRHVTDELTRADIKFVAVDAVPNWIGPSVDTVSRDESPYVNVEIRFGTVIDRDQIERTFELIREHMGQAQLHDEYLFSAEL